MRGLALILMFLTGPAWADPIAALERCLGPAFEARATKAFKARFAHQTCAPLATCPRILVETATVLAEQSCWQEAMQGCATAADPARCAAHLVPLLGNDLNGELAAIKARLRRLPPEALPPLLARRLADPKTVQIDRRCDAKQAATLAPLAPQDACALLIRYTNKWRLDALHRQLQKLEPL